MGRPPSSDVDRFLGHRIKRLRLLSGMSQQQVAKQLGFSPQQVHKYENGISQFSAGRLLAIARVFNVAVADLFDGYHRGAPPDPLVDPKTWRMLRNVAHSFLKPESKHQDALIRLTRALAAEG